MMITTIHTILLVAGLPAEAQVATSQPASVTGQPASGSPVTFHAMARPSARPADSATTPWSPSKGRTAVLTGALNLMLQPPSEGLIA